MAMKATMAAAAPDGPARSTETAKTVSRAFPAATAIRLKVIAQPFSQLPAAGRVGPGVGWVGQPAAGSGIDGPEAAYPALVVDDRLVEVAAPHVGPQDLGEDQLAVGDLPQQEIGDARL